jgi:hypothetical protein
VVLGEKVGNHGQLEKQIEFLAAREGVDTTKPFPFIIEGTVESVDYTTYSYREKNLIKRAPVTATAQRKFHQGTLLQKSSAFSQRITEAFLHTEAVQHIFTFLRAMDTQAM